MQTQNEQLKISVLSSLLVFIKVFYKLKTGREFITPNPIGRPSHYKIIADTLEATFLLKKKRVIINVPPGFGKSTFLTYFIAWAMAHYPDAQFLYISYGYELAEKHTATVKEIMSMPLYKELFGVTIDGNSSAKGDFMTNFGGRVKAFGSSGPITGQDAGLPGQDRFTGCAIIDDAHKPDEVHSDARRESVIRNYVETIMPRPRAANVPIIFIGQVLHEADLANYLRNGEDGYEWDATVLQALDEAGNALAPHLKNKEDLEILKTFHPYVFASQYQQNAIPSGGALFKTDWFLELDEEPKILSTFITADTAETDKTYNDATVFSFWGVYKIRYGDIETDEYALHLLDCVEMWIEPKDLESSFLSFYTDCMRHPVKPKYGAIEKKSTGTTLISVLKTVPGIRIVEIERNAASGSKADRFLEAQPYVAQKRITLPRHGRHNRMFIEHMSKITANMTHRRDDIADTAVDAVRIALIDKTLLPKDTEKSDNVMKEMAAQFNHIQGMRRGRGW